MKTGYNSDTGDYIIESNGHHIFGYVVNRGDILRHYFLKKDGEYTFITKWTSDIKFDSELKILNYLYQERGKELIIDKEKEKIIINI